MAIFAYRKAVNEKIDAWARGHGGMLHCSCWGGFLFGNPGYEDPVVMSLAYIHHSLLVDKALPHPDDVEESLTRGFLRV